MAVDDVVLAGSDDGLHYRGGICAVSAADGGEYSVLFDVRDLPSYKKQGFANHVGLNSCQAAVGGWQRRG